MFPKIPDIFCNKEFKSILMVNINNDKFEPHIVTPNAVQFSEPPKYSLGSALVSIPLFFYVGEIKKKARVFL